MITDFMNLQVSKDFQDGIDRDNLNLIGVKEKPGKTKDE